MFAASGWPKTPNTPHSSWNLSSSIGSLRTFSCTASPGERGERSVQGSHSPCNDARTRRSHGHFHTTVLPRGPANRHGMPKLPVGQTVTKGWPVLDLGRLPTVPLSKWELAVDGAVEEPLRLAWKDFIALPQTKDVSDFHCVTTWSKR